MSAAIEPDDTMEGGAAPQAEGAIELLGQVALERAPADVIREAERSAKALTEILARKPDAVMMNGHRYLEFEDWQTIARFYGVTVRLEGTPEYVEFHGEIRGFRAEAVAVSRDGEIVSRASAYCLTDEEKWRSRPKYEWHYVLKDGTTSAEDPRADEMEWEPNPNKPGKSRPVRRKILAGEESVPLFQLASMAQTRSCAKALRNVFACVAVLAGVKPTPAEELTGGGPSKRSAPPAGKPAEAPKADPAMREKAPPKRAPITKEEADYLFKIAADAGLSIEHDADKRAWITVTDAIAQAMKMGVNSFPLRNLSATNFDKLVSLIEKYIDERGAAAGGGTSPSGPVAATPDSVRPSRMDAADRQSTTPDNAAPQSPLLPGMEART